MANDDDLFLTIIGKLAKGGVLNDIVLIGSWVLPIYRAYFKNAPEIPVLRTTDVDFLVGMPPKVRREFDVPSASVVPSPWMLCAWKLSRCASCHWHMIGVWWSATRDMTSESPNPKLSYS